MKTLADLFLAGLDASTGGPVLADPISAPPSADLAWLPANEIQIRVAGIVRAFQAEGLQPGERIGLLSENRSEWALVDYAAQISRLAIVPLYPTLGPEAVAYILAHSGARMAFVSNPLHAATVASQKDRLPDLQRVVQFSEASGGSDAIALGEWERTTEADADREWLETWASKVQPDDLASIVYTSGTTGEPKGVMLSHRNIVSNVRSAMAVLPLHSTDVAFSFLPLSHIFERTVDYCLWRAGARIVYSPKIEWVVPLMQEVHPTFFAGVPRLFEKVYQGVLDAAATGDIFHRLALTWASHVADNHAKHMLGRGDDPGFLSRKWADLLVWRKVKDVFGGRVRLCLNGGAPLRREICRFFWGCGVEIYGGYGLTEAAPILSTNYPGNAKCHTVGPCLPGQELELGDDGEVLARGDNVMPGYWNDPEATARAIRNGWLCTGDLGEIDRDGHLSIIGRKKEILVTSGGKNVAPVGVEEAIKGSELVEDVMLVGDGRHFLSALVVPSEAALRSWCEEADGSAPGGAWEEILSRPDVCALYESEIAEATSALSHHERPKKISLLPRGFLFDEEELTATGKLRRKVIEDHFKDTIDALYG